MTESENILLKDIQQNVQKAMGMVNTLKLEKKELEFEKSKLLDEIERLKEENEMIQRKYDNLKLAKSLIEDGDNVDAKLKINKIVREIDKCIALLNR
ncbi:hypothetical protein EYV94_13940 [Puteibacter caeruleilacunae]|nr:hypothetical protein EYV94_13940 [Puteibacter caeruleilacunae]